MADEWEIQNGLDPTIDDSRLDLDGDGAFNRFEYVRGTSPSDPGETPPNAPATISITAPQSGAIFIQGQTVSISVSATDSDTGVSKVEFLKDGVLGGALWDTNIVDNNVKYIFTPSAPPPQNGDEIKTSGFRWYWNPPIKSSGKRYLELVEEEIN